MPHFHAIAIFRSKDYQVASIPVFPVKRGISVTKHYITLYIISFMVATLMLILSDYAGYNCLLFATSVSVGWLTMALQGYKSANDDKV